MGKFNRVGVKPPVAGTPIQTVPGGAITNARGGVGFVRTPQAELYLLGISNFVGEETFHEGSGKHGPKQVVHQIRTTDRFGHPNPDAAVKAAVKADRDARFAALVAQVAVENPDWIAGFLPWLRKTANMRSASLTGGLIAAHAMLAAGIHGSRSIVASVQDRADEPGEAFAFWVSSYGRNVPMPVKRGIGDAAVRLYTERSAAKYDTSSVGFRFGDVIQLSHARPKARWQEILFKHLMDRRFNPQAEVPEELSTLAAKRAISSPDGAELTTEEIREAGATWQNVLSAATDKKAAWEAVIPTMGYMALLRNLRNFDEAGISGEVAGRVIAKLADPEEVKRSRQFPYRFLSAFKELAGLRWASALEAALNYSLANIPELPGTTLILVDRSGSMFGKGISQHSKSDWAEVGGVFGAALAVRNRDRSTLVQFGSSATIIPTPAGASVLRLVSRMGNLGGTNTIETLNATFNGHSRVIVITDEQYNSGHASLMIPHEVPIYTFNLAGYAAAQFESSANRVVLGGGLTDGSFRLIPLLEAGSGARWPWEDEETA